MGDVYFSGLRHEILVGLSLEEAEDIMSDLDTMRRNGMSSKLIDSIILRLDASIKEMKKWDVEYGIKGEMKDE